MGLTAMQKINKGLGLFIEGMGEFFQNVVEAASDIIERFNKSIIEVPVASAKNSSDPRKRKAYIIYHRTKKKRIKEKQLKIMRGW